jgi:5-methylcytosine-specific restriction endonuclease McrA
LEVLVLSLSYEPIERIPWQRAMTLLFSGKVVVVGQYEGRELRSASGSWPMPAVVKFVRPHKRRKGNLKFSKRNIYVRDGGKCQYCKKQVEINEATYDHVVPRQKGGKTDWENIVIACHPCNQRKGCKSLEQAGLRLDVPPSKPQTLPERTSFLRWSAGMPEEWKFWFGLGDLQEQVA